MVRTAWNWTRYPLILGKKEEITEGREAGRASNTKLPHWIQSNPALHTP